MTFPDWVKTQQHGTLKKMERAGVAGYTTLGRVAHGELLSDYRVAQRISEATGGAVSIAELCEPDAKRDGEAAE